MAANTTPIYSIVGVVTSDNATAFPVALVTATADYTGASTNHKLIFTADATNGSFLARLRFKATGTNTPTVARIYINNGADQTVAANNVFFGEVSLPGTTASNTVATAEIDYPMGFALDPGFRIYVGLATTVAASWICTGIGGNY